MSTSNPLLTKSYVATSAVLPYRIVTFGSNDGEVVTAAAATDLLVGVSDEIGQATVNMRLDVHEAGEVLVVAGGSITRGAKVTSDANGAAVAAAPAQGANAQVIGIAKASASAGDIFTILLAPSTMQGA